MEIWNNVTYNPGNASVLPSITFPYNGETLMITPTVVCEALHIHVKIAYNSQLVMR